MVFFTFLSCPMHDLGRNNSWNKLFHHTFIFRIDLWDIISIATCLWATTEFPAQPSHLTDTIKIAIPFPAVGFIQPSIETVDQRRGLSRPIQKCSIFCLFCTSNSVFNFFFFLLGFYFVNYCYGAFLFGICFGIFLWNCFGNSFGNIVAQIRQGDSVITWRHKYKLTMQIQYFNTNTICQHKYIMATQIHLFLGKFFRAHF